MLWKIYHLETGKILTAGFTEEENAKEWLEERQDFAQEDFIIEEMDSDEEEEWLEAHPDGFSEEGEDPPIVNTFDDDDDDFSDDYFESGDLESEYLVSGADDEE